jgi:beta-glucosidase
MKPRLALACATLLLSLLGAHAATTPFPQCARDMPAAQLDAQIDALIARMTPAERIAQLGDRAPAIGRLGIPAYNWWNEGLHGIARNGYATVFPQAIGLAATWDPQLLHEVGATVSIEARAKFNGHANADSARYAGLTIWSPNINIFRDPRWGRGQETYGEDPFLTAALGTQFVRGVQGDEAFYLRADATPKHFVAHSGPEAGRDSFNSVVSAHDLTDTYLQAFHAVTTQANAAAMMCSYNAINGTPSCADTDLLTQRVRAQWHFAGYIVSDCDAVGNIHAYQHYAENDAQGAADALKAGVDLDCGNSYNALNDALATKLVTEQQIDTALHRLLLARLRLGMLQPANCTAFAQITPGANDTPAHRALARRAAAESIVLLHNDGTLPLRHNARIAVIGPDADALNILEANYHGTASHPVTPLEGLRRAFPQVLYAQGSTLAEGVAVPLPETALRQSIAADTAPVGLHATYFTTGDLSGAPAVQTSVRTVDLDLDRVGPSPAIRSKLYSARWSGYFVPPAAGDYTLRVRIERCWDCKPTAHDSFRLLIGGKVLLDNHGDAAPDHILYHAADTTPQPLTLELRHTGDDEGITLEWEPPAATLLAEATATARKADVVVAVLGLSPDLEGEALQLNVPGFDGGDRTALALPAPQLKLLEQLRATGKPVVVVLTSGSAVALPSDGLSALLEAWYPGEEGGDAIADVLSGNADPSGRMPVTVYRSVADLPAFSDYSMAHRTYRYFDRPVLYPFGSGSSYTHFRYSQLVIADDALSAGAATTVSVTIANTGQRAGDAVPEFYITPPALPGMPRLALRGFTRIHLQPGESRRITLPLDADALSFVDAAGNRSVRAGSYRIFVGDAQPDTGAAGSAATLTIHGEQARPL